MVLVEQCQKICLSAFAKKHLALAWHNVLLHIVRHPLVDREIFGISWHFYLHLIGQRKEIIYGVARVENYGSVVQKVDLLFANIPRSHGLDVNKRTKIHLQLVLLHEVLVDVFSRLRWWLGDQNTFYFEFAFG